MPDNNDTISTDSEISYSFDFNVPNVQSLDITPTTQEQAINAPAGVSGYSPINVGAVDSTIDQNIKSQNIREGIEILGVEGDLIELKGQEKTVNPTTTAQNITPDNNFNGLTKVTVNAVTSAIDSDIKSENILQGKNILGVEGEAVELKGESLIVNLTNKDGQTFTPTGENNGITSILVNPKNKNVTIQPQTTSQTVGIESGFSGNGEINVRPVTKTIDTNIQSYNIKQGVEILNVQGSVIELEGEEKTVNLTDKEGQTFYPSNGHNGLTSLTVLPNNENRTINPSTQFQTIEINNGFSGNGTLAVMPVTNSIDANIKPQNIRNGISILGVRGSMPTVINNTDLTVNPSTEEQIITPAGNYTGFDEVTVNPVTSAIDENITANNIKDGVTILGVTGEVVELNADSLSVTPTTSAQTITPTSPINGFNEVNVSAVTSSIDSNITAGNIKSGVTILGVQGTVTELNGETKSVSLTNSAGQTFTPTSPKNAITSITVTPNNEARTVTPTTSQQSLSVNSGYSGNGTITVDAVTSSIDPNIQPENIKKDVVVLGITGTLEAGGSFTGINREVVNGVYRTPVTSFNWSMPSNATDVDTYALREAFSNSTGITSANMSGLTTISGQNALSSAFQNCAYLTSVDLSSLTTVSGLYALSSTFISCSRLTSVNLSSLTTVSGSNAMQNAFYECSALTSINLSNLATISGSYSMSMAFYGCTRLSSVDLSGLTTLSAPSGLNAAFSGCTALTTINLSNLASCTALSCLAYAFSDSGLTGTINFNSLVELKGKNSLQGAFARTTVSSVSFPVLNSSSFGTNTNQFNTMLSGVTGCTVHFPSNLQSIIGSWTDVTAGFGGTNTTVLFDLAATT